MKTFRHKLHIALALLIVLVLVLGSFQMGQAQDVEEAPSSIDEAPPAEIPPEIEQPQAVNEPAPNQSAVEEPPPAELPPAELPPAQLPPAQLPPEDDQGGVEEPSPDVAPPTFVQPPNMVVPATDQGGAAVIYAMPQAFDDRDGLVTVGCDPPPGVFFAVGDTRVLCWAQDNSGNVANTELWVSVLPFPIPAPTQPPPAPTEPPPTPTAPPTNQAPSPTPGATSPVASTEVPDDDREVSPTTPAEATSTPMTPEGETPGTEVSTPGTEVSTATPSPTMAATPVAGRIGLPWPPPPGFIAIIGSGPVGDLSLIWGYRDFRISQEYGHTAFSLSMPHWYAYGRSYGLDGYAHPGLDISMPAGTPLYSPVNGTVTIAGGTRGFTHYGNGSPGVGQLTIRTDNGDEVILGHMGNIVVQRGQRVSVGEFVGLSGGMNGDHLHLETRELQPGGGFRVVDPRDSFLLMHLSGEAEIQGGCGDQDGLDQPVLMSCTDVCSMGESSSLGDPDCADMIFTGPEISTGPEMSIIKEDFPQFTGMCSIGVGRPSGEATPAAEQMIMTVGTEPVIVTGRTEPAVNIVSASDWLNGPSDDATMPAEPDTVMIGTEQAMTIAPASNWADPCNAQMLISGMPVTGGGAVATTNQLTQVLVLLIGASGFALGAAFAIRQDGGGPRRRIR